MNVRPLRFERSFEQAETFHLKCGSTYTFWNEKYWVASSNIKCTHLIERVSVVQYIIIHT